MKRKIKNLFGGKAERRARRAESTAPLDSTVEGLDFDAELDAAFGQTVKRPRKKGIAAFFSIRNIIILLCFTVFVVCAVILIYRAIDYKRTDALYDELAADMFREVSDDPSILTLMPTFTPDPSLLDYHTAISLGKSEGEVSENTAVVGDIHYARIRAKLEEIRSVNPDIIGWIKIDETEINYPVVVGDDNDYYLTHAYNGEYLRSGTIFADYRCSKTSLYDNRNTVLYGHSMASGSMFAAIYKYTRNPQIFENNIYIYGFDGIYVYEPILFLDTEASFYYFQVRFGSNDEFVEFMDKMKAEAIWKKKDLEIKPSDRIITLSTCAYDTITGRHVLMGRLVRVEYKAG